MMDSTRGFGFKNRNRNFGGIFPEQEVPKTIFWIKAIKVAA